MGTNNPTLFEGQQYVCTAALTEFFTKGELYTCVCKGGSLGLQDDYGSFTMPLFVSEFELYTPPEDKTFPVGSYVNIVQKSRVTTPRFPEMIDVDGPFRVVDTFVGGLSNMTRLILDGTNKRPLAIDCEAHDFTPVEGETLPEEDVEDDGFITAVSSDFSDIEKRVYAAMASGEPDILEVPADFSLDNLIVSDGGSTAYYQLPDHATELRHLISAKGMSKSRGDIFKACYRLGEKDGATTLYDLRKMRFFIEDLIEMHERGEHL